jgi:hypothetical protein
LREGGPILEQALPHVSRDNVVVAMVQRALVDQKKIRAGAQKAERALAPDVVRILFSFDENWVGEVSLYFRIVISDDAAKPARLRESTQRIIARVSREIKADDLGLETYFNFRSRSEQEELKDPLWERE